MGAITRDKITDDQLAVLLWHFDQYKRHLEAVGERELHKYNFLERKKFKKLRDEVNKFWNELDKID
tara:strand:- start:1128 stop:1325 length:198 start_codon:yes stop_codon:yes gene_type:complete